MRGLLLTALLLAGCGGHGGGSSAPKAKGGRAVLRVEWPARNARLIPSAANSLVVTLTKADSTPVGTPRTVARPPSGTNTTSTTFSGLPYGDLRVAVAAYPNADGTGVAQAAGTGTMAVGEDAPGALMVAMDSKVANLSISPTSTLLAVGGSKALTASATDASGAIVLLAAGGGSEAVAWTSGDAGVATVTTGAPTATLTGVAAGTTTVTATLKVKDDGATVQATSAVEAKASTLGLRADDAGFVYGSKVRVQQDHDYLPEIMVVSAILAPIRSTPTAVVFSATGPIGFPAGATKIIPANGAIADNHALPFHVDVDTPATLTVAAGSLTGAATVLLKANPLASATGPASVASGAVGTGTVSLGLYAAASETVALACDDPAVTLPASVTVPGPYRVGATQHYAWIGTMTADFAFTAPAVTVARTVTITATRAGSAKAYTFTITP